MLVIDNKELQDAYLGSEPIVEIRLGEDLIWPTTVYVEWWDSEFGSVVEKALNDGNSMTPEQVLAVTNDDFANVSFKGDTKLLSIRDLEKFTNVSSIPINCFASCTALGTAVPDGADTSEEGSLTGTDGYVYSTLTIPSNISLIGAGGFYSCSGYKSMVIDHNVGTFGNTTIQGTANGGTDHVFNYMTGLSGNIDISKYKSNGYHEFENFGSSDGVNVIMNSGITSFEWCFTNGSNIKAIADSEENLESGKYKLPSSLTSMMSCFSNTNSGAKFYIPDTVTAISMLAGGDGSWVTFNLLDLGSGLTTLEGGVFDYNQGSNIVICRSTTPPVMGVRNVWGISSGHDYNNYPFAQRNPTTIYVPSEAIEAYEADEQYSVYDDSTDTRTYGTGAVSCYKADTEQSIVIGWSRFAGKFKALEGSEYE